MYIDYVSNEVFRKINTYSRTATSMKQINRRVRVKNSDWKIQVRRTTKLSTKDCICNNYITKLEIHITNFDNFFGLLAVFSLCINVRLSHFCIPNLAFLPTTPLNSSSPDGQNEAVALKRQRTTVEDLLNSTTPDTERMFLVIRGTVVLKIELKACVRCCLIDSTYPRLGVRRPFRGRLTVLTS